MLVDAAIDGEIDGAPAGVDQRPERLDLAELARDEALAAKSRVDAHHQHQIDVAQDRFDGVDRRRRVERDPHPLARALDALESAIQVGACFDVDGYGVGTGLGEGLDIGIDRRDHQMHVEGPGAVGPEGCHDTRTDGQVGHEVAIHHIDVQPVRTGFRDRPHLLAKARKVRRQNGRCDPKPLLHGEVWYQLRDGAASVRHRSRPSRRIPTNATAWYADRRPP